ncbi:hypothetical protein CRG98_026751 [Punica granatum]|uniref:ABC transporter domain-containing protein n=1 Tax=Punica granatum TaxID=22663 RepID=A0A2I0JAM1_PUNGR|nr:hypothetical protein CRG98_026751 [Punica granatum]
MLKEPRLLLLDEATSVLDSQSERVGQDALEELMKGKTMPVDCWIVIAMGDDNVQLGSVFGNWGMRITLIIVFAERFGFLFLHNSALGRTKAASGHRKGYTKGTKVIAVR